MLDTPTFETLVGRWDLHSVKRLENSPQLKHQPLLNAYAPKTKKVHLAMMGGDHCCLLPSRYCAECLPNSLLASFTGGDGS